MTRLDAKITLWNEEFPPTREIIEKRMKKEGFSPWPWTDKAGTQYGDHQHENSEVRWIYKGKLIIGTAGETFTLNPGDRLDMPPNTIHWAKVPLTGPVSYLCGEK